ncbi:MAG: chromosome segregation protein [Blastocatellia bacterium]|jgi:chromosome segregation protein|nr:chromosome segregation protein [Blastocatellia bacterium]
MFKLQRLEITGFKSFADYTNLVFTGDGITAVVGPNGCGKSNVADAIAWVLGEQRIKHLRGAEMKDVIFQGSRNRQPSGMAEVVLHLVRDETVENEPDIEDIDSTLELIDEQAVVIDTPVLAEPVLVEEVIAAEVESIPVAAEAPEGTPTEALVPTPTTRAHGKRHWRKHQALEFAPGEAVSVTRRLYRSGESEYLLNDRPCRLRDIQDLFSGTGLSGGHYAIIEQGRIGQILSAKPMDRRTIIEEAAGITKFRVRQRAAEARLESARGNLSRISDIIAEIDRQVNSLRRQAAKAKRYRVSREELRELLRAVYVAEDRTLSRLLDHTQQQLEEANRTEEALAAELTQREADSHTATVSARDLEDQLAQVRAAVGEAALQRDRRIRERSYQQEQIAALELRRTELQREIEALSERVVLVDAEGQRLGELEARLAAENDESALTLLTAEEAHAQKLAEVSNAESAIEETRAQLLTHTAAAERLSEIAHQLESAIERLAQQAEGLKHEGERAANAHADRTAEAEKLENEINHARERLSRLVAERETALRAVVEGHERVSDTDAELTRIRDEHSRTQHRLESLRELDQRRANYSSTVQEIFSANAEEDFHFIGTLADAIRVESRWERAVEGIFGSTLQTVLVPTPDDAARASMWLQAHNAGRAAFLVTGIHGASGETEVAGYRPLITERESYRYAPLGIDGPRVAEVIDASTELLAVLERTLPEKMNARIVDTIDDALALSLATGDTFVTVEGDWVTGGQFVSAGNARAIEESAGLLGFKRELRELEATATELAGQTARANEAVKEARARLVDLEEAVVLLNEVIGRDEREALGRELTASSLKQDLERAVRHMRVVADDAERLAGEQRELAERRFQALAEASAAETARLATVERVTEASARLLSARREAESENELLNEQRSVAAAAAERRRSTSTELRRLHNESADLKSRVARHTQEIAEITARLEELRQSISEIDALAAGVDEEKAQEEQRIATATVQLNEARDRADAIASELAEVNRRAATSRDARAAIEVQRAEGQARLNYVREACTTELGQNLAELASEHAVDEGFDLESGRARVEELRARIESYGAVNMMALEELAEAEERFTFLTAQREDIFQGIASTEEALREIKRRSRERFRAAFEQINQNFGELFKELFGGGRGEMSLIDADDALESGIDVIAQPPGKRLQNVLLLSGGEKAMAALALVLGIFHYRPAPFCLLDEVDAPLDEANVGRFTAKVAQMSANTQFIVITHNKRTMEMARALYGVTMEEAGVSKLVSVKFE